MSADARGSTLGAGGEPLSPAALVIPFLDTLAVSGVALSVFSRTGQRATVAASDATAARIDELQFELGEGPGFDVMTSGTPWQLHPRDQNDGVNPFFLAAVRELDVATIISLPLTLGSVSAGVATLYRKSLGALSASEMTTAAALVQWVTGPATQRALVSAERDGPDQDGVGGGLHREVHQATGMIIAQLDVSATEAFARLRAHAFSTDQSVQDVSHQVTSRQLNFADQAHER